MIALSPVMRAALEQAQHAPLRRVHKPGPGAPSWPAAPNTLRALTRRGLLELGQIRNRDGWPVDTWTLSDAGRAALQPVEIFRVEPIRYLSRGAVNYYVRPDGRWAVVEDEPDSSGDYTTDPRRSIHRDQPPNSKTLAAVPALSKLDLERFAGTARRREHARRRKNGHALDAQPLPRRVDDLERTARQHRVDITSELRLIRHMLDNDRDDNAVARIEQLETGLGRRAA